MDHWPHGQSNRRHIASLHLTEDAWQPLLRLQLYVAKHLFPTAAPYLKIDGKKDKDAPHVPRPARNAGPFQHHPAKL